MNSKLIYPHLIIEFISYSVNSVIMNCISSAHRVWLGFIDSKPRLLYHILIFCKLEFTAVVPTKSDSGVILCLLLLGKTLTCTLHMS